MIINTKIGIRLTDIPSEAAFKSIVAALVMLGGNVDPSYAKTEEFKMGKLKGKKLTVGIYIDNDIIYSSEDCCEAIYTLEQLFSHPKIVWPEWADDIRAGIEDFYFCRINESSGYVEYYAPISLPAKTEILSKSACVSWKSIASNPKDKSENWYERDALPPIGTILLIRINPKSGETPEFVPSDDSYYIVTAHHVDGEHFFVDLVIGDNAGPRNSRKFNKKLTDSSLWCPFELADNIREMTQFTDVFIRTMNSAVPEGGSKCVKETAKYFYESGLFELKKKE